MQISSWRCFLLLPLLAAGCGSSGPGDGVQSAEVQAADEADKIECRIGDADEFERVCAIERATGADGLELTLRHPDGGFRRVLVTRDGRGVVAADGAEPAEVSVIGDDRIEVTLAGDRYRLPATVRGGAAAE